MLALLQRYLLPIAFGAGVLVGASVTGIGGHYWQEWVHDPAVRKEALKGFVAEAEYDALAARLGKAIRDQKIASNALESYRLQAEGEALVEQQQEAINRQVTGDYEARRKAAGKLDPMAAEDWDFIEGRMK